MEAIIGLVGTVIGACIAGGFMFYKDRQKIGHEKAKAKKELLLRKYEEIYSDLAKYALFASEVSMQMISEAGYAGKFDPNKIDTKLKDNKLGMNIMFYAPVLVNQAKEIENKYIIIGRAVTRFLLEVDASPDRKGEVTGEAAVAATEISQLVKSTQEDLAKLVSEQVSA